MGNIEYGYIRVSSTDQNEDRQRRALEGIGIRGRRLFVDKQSGKDFERPAYRRMVSRLKEGDTVFCLSVDRLGRDYREVLEQWRILTKDIGVDLVILDMPLLDTRREKNLLGTFIADLVLQILSFVAESERDNIRRRQEEGIRAAKERGVHLGRPRKEIPVSFWDIFPRWRQGLINGVEAARLCGMPIYTFRRRAADCLAYGEDLVREQTKKKRKSKK